MNEQAPPIECEDAAWVSFKTPLSCSDLTDFCNDVQRLLRINPYLEVKQWQTLSINHYHFEAVNSSTNPAITLDIDIEVEPLADGIRLNYSRGIKASTTFKIKPDAEASCLTIVDEYDSTRKSDQDQCLNEVDKSLVKWAEDIQAYLVHWQRWSKLPVWRWYMKHIWQPMKPSARRITYMLLWITLVEISLILLGAALYTIEY